MNKFIFLAGVLLSMSKISCVSSEGALKEEKFEKDLEKRASLFVQHNSDLGKKMFYTVAKRVPVENILSSEITSLIEEMKEKVAGNGIGLAANQVGKAVQVFLIGYSSDPKGPAYTERYKTSHGAVPLQIFINPRIVDASSEKMSFWHGCLSALDKDLGLVATYKWIKYEAYNEKAEKITGILDGLGAIIFQHEFRHLLGSLYIHKADVFKTREELEKLFKSGDLKSYDKADNTVPHLISDYIIGDSLEEHAAKQKQ